MRCRALLAALRRCSALPVRHAGAVPAPPAGRVKVVAGDDARSCAAARRRRRPSATQVFEADVLRTGADGRLSVMLKDESRVALGPNSELALTRFAYAPADSQLGARPAARARRAVVRLGPHRQAGARLGAAADAHVDHRRARHARAGAGGGAMTRGIAAPVAAALVRRRAAVRRLRRAARRSSRLRARATDRARAAPRERRARAPPPSPHPDGAVPLTRAGEGVRVQSAAAPSAPGIIPADEIQRLFGDALAALPPPARRFLLLLRHRRRHAHARSGRSCRRSWRSCRRAAVPT